LASTRIFSSTRTFLVAKAGGVEIHRQLDLRRS